MQNTAKLNRVHSALSTIVFANIIQLDMGVCQVVRNFTKGGNATITVSLLKYFVSLAILFTLYGTIISPNFEESSPSLLAVCKHSIWYRTIY